MKILVFVIIVVGLIGCMDQYENPESQLTPIRDLCNNYLCNNPDSHQGAISIKGYAFHTGRTALIRSRIFDLYQLSSNCSSIGQSIVIAHQGYSPFLPATVQRDENRREEKFPEQILVAGEWKQNYELGHFLEATSIKRGQY